MDQPVTVIPVPELLLEHDPFIDNPIIREFILLRNQRNGGVISEVPTPVDNSSSCLSESFLLSQASELSLRHNRRPHQEETPESDIVSEPTSQILGRSLPSAAYSPILNTDSEELNSRLPQNVHIPALMRRLSMLYRYRRLMEDLEILQGIRVGRLPGVETEESESEENSFTELMLAVDHEVPSAHLRNIVKWLAEHLRRLRKIRLASIDGIMMLHGMSQPVQNSGPSRHRLHWYSLKYLNSCSTKNSHNFFARLMGHWRTPQRPESQATFLINRLPDDRFSSYF